MQTSEIIKKVLEFKKSEKYAEVRKRLKDFDFSGKEHHEWFSELCFCLLTANATAEGGIKVQNALGRRFHLLNEKQLSSELKNLRYRFPNKRAHYIFKAQGCFKIKDLIQNLPSREARDFLVKNIKGLGMKEASHFLRNTGRTDVAIIDRHILRSMGKEVKSISRKEYEDAERILEDVARKTKTSLAELDLILWAIQTGKILK